MSTIDPQNIPTDIPPDGSGDPAAPRNYLSATERGAKVDIQTEFTNAKTDIEGLEQRFDVEHRFQGGPEHSLATQSEAGFMSDTDKTKLDGVDPNANDYTHPNHSGEVTSAGDGAQTITDGAVIEARLGAGAVTNTKIGNGAVSNAKQADMPANTIKARVGSTGVPVDLDIEALADGGTPDATNVVLGKQNGGSLVKFFGSSFGGGGGGDGIQPEAPFTAGHFGVVANGTPGSETLTTQYQTEGNVARINNTIETRWSIKWYETDYSASSVRCLIGGAGNPNKDGGTFGYQASDLAAFNRYNGSFAVAGSQCEAYGSTFSIFNALKHTSDIGAELLIDNTGQFLISTVGATWQESATDTGIYGIDETAPGTGTGPWIELTGLVLTLSNSSSSAVAQVSIRTFSDNKLGRGELEFLVGLAGQGTSPVGLSTILEINQGFDRLLTFRIDLGAVSSGQQYSVYIRRFSQSAGQDFDENFNGSLGEPHKLVIFEPAAGGGGSGEVNTQPNIGSGVELGLPKNGVTLPLRTFDTGQFETNGDQVRIPAGTFVDEAPTSALKYVRQGNATWTEETVPPIGGTALAYTFDSGTTASPPSGEIRTNNANLGLATAVYVSSTTRFGNDASAAWGTLQPGDLIQVADETRGEFFRWYALSGTPVDNTGAWTLPVTALSGGATSITDGRPTAAIIAVDWNRFAPLTLTDDGELVSHDGTQYIKVAGASADGDVLTYRTGAAAGSKVGWEPAPGAGSGIVKGTPWVAGDLMAVETEAGAGTAESVGFAATQVVRNDVSGSITGTYPQLALQSSDGNGVATFYLPDDGTPNERGYTVAAYTGVFAIAKTNDVGQAVSLPLQHDWDGDAWTALGDFTITGQLGGASDVVRSNATSQLTAGYTTDFSEQSGAWTPDLTAYASVHLNAATTINAASAGEGILPLYIAAGAAISTGAGVLVGGTDPGITNPRSAALWRVGTTTSLVWGPELV